jgi:hypothetical protein
MSATWVLPLANAMIAVVLLYAMNMSWGYFVESRTKRQLTGCSASTCRRNSWRR